VRHGDTPQSELRKQAAIPPDILITTPETLQECLPAKVMQRHLKNVRYVIVDEFTNSRTIVAVRACRCTPAPATGNRTQFSANRTLDGRHPESIALSFGGEILSRSSPRHWRSTTNTGSSGRDPLIRTSRRHVTFISPRAAAGLSAIDDSVDENRSTLVFVTHRLAGTVGLPCRSNVLARLVHPSPETDPRASSDRHIEASCALDHLDAGDPATVATSLASYNSPRHRRRRVPEPQRAGCVELESGNRFSSTIVDGGKTCCRLGGDIKVTCRLESPYQGSRPLDRFRSASPMTRRGSREESPLRREPRLIQDDRPLRESRSLKLRSVPVAGAGVQRQAAYRDDRREW